MPSKEKLEKKVAYFERILSLIQKCPRLLIVNADHVGSRQMAEIRNSLRGKAYVLMGKNTMIRKALRQKVSDMPQLDKLIPYVKLNIGFVFCVDEPTHVKKIISENTIPAPAKQGVVAPLDVFIPPGPTGMDPQNTSFFQALGITTKLSKGQIEINSEVHLIKKNEKVSPSAATLLQKLNIKPFNYGLKVENVYDDGAVYNASVLDMTNEDILKIFQDGIKNIAALSKETGIPTQASVPHSIIEAFKYCVALVINTDYKFPQMEIVKQSLEKPQTANIPSQKTESKENKQDEAEAKEESEDEELGLDIFG